MLDERVPVATHDEVGRAVARLQRDAGAAVRGRRRDPRVQPAPGRRDRGGDARSGAQERGAGAAQPAACARCGRSSATRSGWRRSGSWRRSWRTRSARRSSSVSGHLQLALSARDLPPALRERLQVATREIERIVEDRARLPRLDAHGRSPSASPSTSPRVLDEAVGHRASAPTARARSRASQSDRRRGGASSRPIRACCARSWSTSSPTRSTPCDAGGGHIRDRGGGASGGDGRHHGARRRRRHRARGRGAHLRAVLHDQGARQGHRPRPGHLPRAGDGAGRRASRSRARPGKGSTFTVRLPRAAGCTSIAPNTRSTMTAARRDRRRRDDDPRAGRRGRPVARDLLGEILRGEGYEVEAVDDGAEAIARAGTADYDLVVSDVRMATRRGLRRAGRVQREGAARRRSS